MPQTTAGEVQRGDGCLLESTHANDRTFGLHIVKDEADGAVPLESITQFFYFVGHQRHGTTARAVYSIVKVAEQAHKVGNVLWMRCKHISHLAAVFYFAKAVAESCIIGKRCIFDEKVVLAPNESFALHALAYRLGTNEAQRLLLFVVKEMQRVERFVGGSVALVPVYVRPVVRPDVMLT